MISKKMLAAIVACLISTAQAQNQPNQSRPHYGYSFFLIKDNLKYLDWKVGIAERARANLTDVMALQKELEKLDYAWIRLAPNDPKLEEILFLRQRLGALTRVQLEMEIKDAYSEFSVLEQKLEALEESKDDIRQLVKPVHAAGNSLHKKLSEFSLSLDLLGEPQDREPLRLRKAVNLMMLRLADFRHHLDSMLIRQNQPPLYSSHEGAPRKSIRTKAPAARAQDMVKRWPRNPFEENLEIETSVMIDLTAGAKTPGGLNLDAPDISETQVIPISPKRQIPFESKEMKPLRQVYVVGAPAHRAFFAHQQTGANTCVIAAEIQILREKRIFARDADPRQMEKRLRIEAAEKGYFVENGYAKGIGTPTNYLGNLLSDYGLLIAKYAHALDSELEQAVQRESSIIAGIDFFEFYKIPELLSTGTRFHAIVITGAKISQSDHKVLGFFINDPWTGKGGVYVPAGRFYPAWRAANSLFVEVL